MGIFVLGSVSAVVIFPNLQDAITDLRAKKVQRDIDVSNNLKNVNIEISSYGILDWETEEVTSGKLCYSFTFEDQLKERCIGVPHNLTDTEQNIIVREMVNNFVEENTPQEEILYAINNRSINLDIGVGDLG